jgi:hypothetical protein
MATLCIGITFPSLPHQSHPHQRRQQGLDQFPLPRLDLHRRKFRNQIQNSKLRAHGEIKDLQSVSSELDHVLHINIFLLEMSDFEAMNAPMSKSWDRTGPRAR